MSEAIIGNKVIKGSFWTIFLNVFLRILGFANILILARFLDPYDLGVFAASAVVIELVNILTSIGVGPVLVQKDKLSELHYQTAWTIQLIRGVIVFLVVQCFAEYFIGVYSDDHAIKQVIQVVAFTVLIGSLSSAYFINYQKSLDFKTIAKFNIICRLVGFFATIIAAYLLQTFWALVIGNFAAAFSRLALTHLFAPGKHRITLAEGKGLIGSSRWVMLHQIFSFISNKADTFLITKLLGPKILGVYDVGYQLAMMPTQEIALPVSRALFPGLAKLQADKHAFRKLLTLSLIAIFYVSVPAGAGLFLVSELLVTCLFPQEWFEAVGIIKILVVFAVIRSFFGPTISALMGAGRLKTNAKLTLFNAIARITFLSCGILYYGLAGLMIAAVLVSFLQVTIYFFTLHRLDMVVVKDFVLGAWRSLVSVVFMMICVNLYLESLPADFVSGGTWYLLVSVALGGVSYVVFLLFAWRFSGMPEGVESRVIDFLRKNTNERLKFLS